MIGSNNYIEYNTPTIIVNDEIFSSSIDNRSTMTLGPEQNNNYPIIDSPVVDYYMQNDQFNGNVMCLSRNVINLDEIPISALRTKSRELLSKRLNAIKVILSEDGAPRDWRGVLNSIGLSDVVSTVQLKNDPMKDVLELWAKQKTHATVGKLQRILGKIDRWDVVDDTSDCFFEDSKIYLDAISKKENNDAKNQLKQVESDVLPKFDDANILTMDDRELQKQGKGPQRYHAYLLFDDSDIDFATQILEKMEMEGLKLCTKERDLIGGTIETDAIMRLISERCDHLVVIYSEAFFHSAANAFFVKFAQAIGVEKGVRKIVPCIKEKCEIPMNLQFYLPLWYRESSPYFNFWNKLATSIHDMYEVRTHSPAILPRIEITEIESPSAESEEQQVVEHPDDLHEKTKTTASTLSVKPKGSKSSRSSPTTPTSLKKIWNNFPKIGSQSTISSSVWTIGANDQICDKENDRYQSSLSLNNSTTCPTPTKFKKAKPFGFVKKWLSPASTDYKLSAESDSSIGNDNSTRKKKWYRKKFCNRNKNREVATNEA